MENYDIYEGLLSSNFIPYMTSLYNLYKKLTKKKNFNEFSNPVYIDLLISGTHNPEISNKDLIYRCFYHLTNIDENPKYIVVWEAIQTIIYENFHNNEITAHLFKIICKIISNFLMAADEDKLCDFIRQDIGFVSDMFSENKDKVHMLKEDDEINDPCYICQGCLRIFSALCNQHEIIQQTSPNLVRDLCMPHFFEALHFQNKHMRITTVKYIYFITNWSPNEVISFLSGIEFLSLFSPLITNMDKGKNCLSFYSTLILKSISKLHDQDIATNLYSFNPFGVDISQLPNHSRSIYLGFLFNIVQTDQKYADEFIQSKSLLSIINQDATDIYDIISIERVNNEKFVKYITCIYQKYPSTREHIIYLLSKINPLYFFFSFLIQQTEAELILIGVECIDDLIQKINNNSEIGKFLKDKLAEKIGDISEDLQCFISDYDDYKNTNNIEDMDTYTNALKSLEILNDKINYFLTM